MKCPNKDAKGVCQMHNMQCGHPHCEREKEMEKPAVTEQGSLLAHMPIVTVEEILRFRKAALMLEQEYFKLKNAPVIGYLYRYYEWRTDEVVERFTESKEEAFAHDSEALAITVKDDR